MARETNIESDKEKEVGTWPARSTGKVGRNDNGWRDKEGNGGIISQKWMENVVDEEG